MEFLLPPSLSLPSPHSLSLFLVRLDTLPRFPYLEDPPSAPLDGEVSPGPRAHVVFGHVEEEVQLLEAVVAGVDHGREGWERPRPFGRHVRPARVHVPVRVLPTCLCQFGSLYCGSIFYRCFWNGAPTGRTQAPVWWRGGRGQRCQAGINSTPNRGGKARGSWLTLQNEELWNLWRFQRRSNEEGILAG